MNGTEITLHFCLLYHMEALVGRFAIEFLAGFFKIFFRIMSKRKRLSVRQVLDAVFAGNDSDFDPKIKDITLLEQTQYKTLTAVHT